MQKYEGTRLGRQVSIHTSPERLVKFVGGDDKTWDCQFQSIPAPKGW